MAIFSMIPEIHQRDSKVKPSIPVCRRVKTRAAFFNRLNTGNSSITPQWGDTKLIVGVENIFDTAYRDASTFANVAFPQTLTNPLVEVGRNFTAKVQHTF
jgi:hypothetical protein